MTVMIRCPICDTLHFVAVGQLWCSDCGKAYDRFHQRTDDGTMMAALNWAAKRARLFERRRGKKSLLKNR